MCETNTLTLISGRKLTSREVKKKRLEMKNSEVSGATLHNQSPLLGQVTLIKFSGPHTKKNISAEGGLVAKGSRRRGRE